MNKTKWIVTVVVLAGAALLVWRWSAPGGTAADDENRGGAGSDGAPVAAVARVERRNMGSTLTIAGAFKPLQDGEVHAKVAGYIRTIYVDVGSRVNQGQTLAVLEVPELAAQTGGGKHAQRTGRGRRNTREQGG